MNVNNIITKALEAEQSLATHDAATRNAFLNELASALKKHKKTVLLANKADVGIVGDTRTEAFIDRMMLNDTRYDSIIEGVVQVEKQGEVVGTRYDKTKHQSGITTEKMRIPLGVIFMIYESRPNVTIDAACLAIKSGNVIILKGGSETKKTNKAFSEAIKTSLRKVGLSEDCVQVIIDDARATTPELLKRSDAIDLVIPRGSRRLLEFVNENSSIATLLHLEGNCHMYIDKDADTDMAVRLVLNAKTQRLGTCNTLESLLVHSDIADDVLADIIEQLDGKGIEIRGDDRAMKINRHVVRAKEDDWSCEYLDAIISVRIVNSDDEAIKHINTYGSGHTDAIVTGDKTTANKFIRLVDSASVMHNTSTRFADGFEYGLGSEIGISTGKLHARGPVGAEGLTTYKWVVYSNGAVRC